MCAHQENTLLLAVAAASRDVVFAAGTAGLVIRTTDGGATWTRLASCTNQELTGLAAEVPHQYLVANNDSVVWAVGRNSAVCYTTDSGNTWETQVALKTQTLNQTKTFE
jgi:photosystem II stability/assembly factor-like uncharacterized protein